MLDIVGAFDDVDAVGDLDELLFVGAFDDVDAVGDLDELLFVGAFDDVDAVGDLDEELDCRTLLLAIICALVLRLVRARRVVTSSVSAMQTCNKRANAARAMIACLENAIGCTEVNLNNETMWMCGYAALLFFTHDSHTVI